MKNFNVTVSKVILDFFLKKIKIKEGDYRLKGIYGPYGEYGFKGHINLMDLFKIIYQKLIYMNLIKKKSKNELYGRKLYNEGYIDLIPICRFILSFFGVEDDCGE